MARLAEAVETIISTYRKKFGEVEFNEERHVAAFGENLPYDETQNTIGTMTDNLLIQVIVMDTVSRLVKYEAEIDRLISVIEDSSKITENRATRRKK